MKHVPNFAMSIPLAHYHIARRDGGDIASADLLVNFAFSTLTFFLSFNSLWTIVYNLT